MATHKKTASTPTNPFGTNPFGTNPFGTNPFGANLFGTNPFGANPFVSEAVKAGRANLDAFAAQVEKAGGFVYEQTVKAHELVEKNSEQANDLVKGQFAAVAASQLAFAKGMMDLTQLGFEQLREAAAQVESTTGQLLASTSVEEAGALQTKFVQAEVDRACGNAQRLADVAAHVADDVTAPLREQAMTTIEDVRATLAA